jgi:hypothetical protein
MSDSAARKKPAAPKQDVFISSVELRLDYLKPFRARHYYLFKQDPRWPSPVLGNAGRQVYRRSDVDHFLERIAEEGFDFSGADQPPSPSPPKPPPQIGKTVKAKTTRPRRRQRKAAPAREIAARAD